MVSASWSRAVMAAALMAMDPRKRGSPIPLLLIGAVRREFVTPFHSVHSSRKPSRVARTFGLNAYPRSEEHTSELQSLTNLVCRLLLEKKKKHYLYIR